MAELSFLLVLAGYRVRSGRACGTDLAAEQGALSALSWLKANSTSFQKLDADSVLDVFLPWRGFNGAPDCPGYIAAPTAEGEGRYGVLHPAWLKLPSPVRKLMGRNAYQVLGSSLENPVKFVLCHTQDGATSDVEVSGKTGGTGHALRIAFLEEIKAFNAGNPSHYSRLVVWATSEKARLLNEFGLNVPECIRTWRAANSPLKKSSVVGDLIEMASEGKIDVLVHGCNCYHKMGSGFAKSLVAAFPEALEADECTPLGDKRKLGTYSCATVYPNGKPLVIVNAYTQHGYSRDPDVLNADYEAIRKVFLRIAKDFSGKRIGFPAIGSGLASGCEASIDVIISEALKKERYQKVILPSLIPKPGAHPVDIDGLFSGLACKPALIEEVPGRVTDDFVFFWHKTSPFSQWNPSRFTLEGFTFANNEQYMMFRKAELFGDLTMAKRILDTVDPHTCKRLGREVGGFVQSVWDEHADRIVLEANALKFSQNESLLALLLAKGNRRMVEASPSDKVWGIGLSQSHPDACRPDRWPGANRLGMALDKTADLALAQGHIPESGIVNYSACGPSF